MIRGLTGIWKKIKINPSAPTYSPLKAQSLNMGYQHGASHTIASGGKKEKTNIVASPWCGVYACDTKIKQQGRWQSEEQGRREENRETERLADPLLAILDRSAVAMATGSPRLVFGAASGITAEDLMFSTHLGSANMVLYSSGRSTLHSQSLVWDTAAGTRATGVENLSPSARLTDRFSSSRQRFLLPHTQCRISRCKQSTFCASSGSAHCWICDNACFFSCCTAFLKLQSSRSDLFKWTKNKEQQYSKMLHIYQCTVFSVIRPWCCKVNEDISFSYLVCNLNMTAFNASSRYRKLYDCFLATGGILRQYEVQ